MTLRKALESTVSSEIHPQREPSSELKRRAFLRGLAYFSAFVPTAFLLSKGDYSGVAYARSDAATASKPALGLLEGSNDGTGEPFPGVPIIRNFANPHLELLRLLREAAEVEHMLMVQYLYAGFSLKPRYQALIGEGDANASSFLGGWGICSIGSC